MEQTPYAIESLGPCRYQSPIHLGTEPGDRLADFTPDSARVVVPLDLDVIHGYVARRQDPPSLELAGPRDIRFRYRILSEMINGQPVPRSRENPYPFSRTAFIDLSYYLSVNDSGLISWGQAIRQMIGHTNLPEYVGDIETEAPYRPE